MDSQEEVLSELLKRALDFIYFLLLPVILFLVLGWALNVIEEATLSFDDQLSKSGTLLLTAFLTGVMVGLKIAGEKGGMLTLVMGLVAILFFNYLTTQDVRGIELYTKYVPMLNTSTPAMLVYLIPGTWFLGVLLYRFFTVSPD
jgi:hypothetical protein